MEHKVYKRYPLGNKRFNWKQKNFALSTFSLCAHGTVIDQDHVPEIVDRSVKHLKEAGFNMGELGWVGHESAWEAVEACEKYGLDLLFQDMSLMGGMSFHHADRKVPREEIKAVVDRLKDKKHTIGYYVWDEPQTDAHMAEARRQMDILQELAPEALLFNCAVPDYNRNPDRAGALDDVSNGLGDTWENGRYVPYIERFAEKMDPPVMSFDYYPVGNYFNVWPGHTYSYENQLDDSFMLLTMAVSRDVALRKNIPFWFYYQGGPLYKCTREERRFVFPMVRCFMYAAILYGAKGLQNYTAWDNAVIDKDGYKSKFFEDQKKIHSEITAMEDTLLALTSKLIIHSDDLLPGCEYTKTYFNTIAESEIFEGKLPKRCSVGELEDDYGNRYAVILNRDYEKELNASLKLKDNFRIYEVSKKDGKHNVICENTNELSVNIAPGDAVIIRVQKASEEAFTLEYQLAE